MLCQFVRLARQGGSFKQHALYLFAERPNTPSLGAAHFRIELTLELVSKGDDFNEVTPTQLSRQRRDDFSVREHFGKPDHPGQIPGAKSFAELRDQFCRQCRQNFLPVFCPLVPKYFRSDTVADLPIKQSESRVDRSGNLFASLSNEVPEISQQGLIRSGERHRIAIRDWSGVFPGWFFAIRHFLPVFAGKRPETYTVA
nr:hypothetical protein [Fimbriiglobus ruber]